MSLRPLSLRQARLFAILVLAGAVWLALATGPVGAQDFQQELLDGDYLSLLEGFNKAIHDFNVRIYTSEPNGSLLSTMMASIPPDVKIGLFNFYSNMTEPVTAVSSLLQGDVDNSWIAMHRFFVNLTMGWGGFYNVADEMGIQSEPVTLGQVICGFGIPDGPFLVIPFYGPTTLSDFVGAMIPSTAGYIAFGYAFAAYRAGTVLADGGEETGASSAKALDYETLKALYLEHRRRHCPEPAAETNPEPKQLVQRGWVPF